MSQPDRKFLIAKRHGAKPFRRPSNNLSISNNEANQSGVKRGLDSEQAEQPPSKKPNRNSSYQPHKSHVSPPSKNLAARRLKNLRNSLEINRRLSEGLPSPACASNSRNDSIKEEVSHFNISTPVCSSPIQIRLKRKHSDKATDSPSVSSSQVIKDISTPSNINKDNTNIHIDLNEEMDWTEIDENDVVNDIIDLRKEIDYNKELPVAEEVNNAISFSTDGVFIVVDTNIFLSQLSILTQLKDKHFAGLGRATVVVPWMVIQELDYMKESHSSGSMVKAARRAVHYINTQLANKDPHFTGQSVMEAAKLEISSKNPDDGILFCCIQLVEKKKFAILLSNDVNLRNKALVNNVQAFNSTDIIKSLNNLKPTNNSEDTSLGQSVQKIKIVLSNVLTHIIECEMKEAYGEVWKKMAMMHPPFTTEEALNCLVKYWVAVFSMSLQKQCKLKVEEFGAFLRHHRNDSHFHSTEFTKFVEYTLSLCIYLKNGYPKYRNLVTDCITNVQNCAER